MWLDKAHSEQFLWFSIVVVTTDRRQFTLFYLFYFSFFLYFICISAFWFALPVT